MRFYLFLLFILQVDCFYNIQRIMQKNHENIFEKQIDFSIVDENVQLNGVTTGITTYEQIAKLVKGLHNLFFTNDWKTLHFKEISKKKFQIDWKYKSLSKLKFPSCLLQFYGTSIVQIQDDKVERHDVKNVSLHFHKNACTHHEDCPGTMSCCHFIYNYCCNENMYTHPHLYRPITVKKA